jgi:hypothetical protein
MSPDPPPGLMLPGVAAAPAVTEATQQSPSSSGVKSWARPRRPWDDTRGSPGVDRAASGTAGSGTDLNRHRLVVTLSADTHEPQPGQANRSTCQ